MACMGNLPLHVRKRRARIPRNQAQPLGLARQKISKEIKRTRREEKRRRKIKQM